MLGLVGGFPLMWMWVAALGLFALITDWLSQRHDRDDQRGEE